jgi:hypothetical protein
MTTTRIHRPHRAAGWIVRRGRPRAPRRPRRPRPRRLAARRRRLAPADLAGPAVRPAVPRWADVTIAYGHQVTGDINEVNALNHYVGLGVFDPATSPRCSCGRSRWSSRSSRWWSRPAAAALGRTARSIYLWALPVGVLAAIQFRLYEFGHDISPARPSGSTLHPLGRGEVHGLELRDLGVARVGAHRHPRRGGGRHLRPAPARASTGCGGPGAVDRGTACRRAPRREPHGRRAGRRARRAGAGAGPRSHDHGSHDHGGHGDVDDDPAGIVPPDRPELAPGHAGDRRAPRRRRPRRPARGHRAGRPPAAAGGHLHRSGRHRRAGRHRGRTSRSSRATAPARSSPCAPPAP